jgi:hypothetical protein
VEQTVEIAEDVLIRYKSDVLKTEVDRLLKLPPTEASKVTLSLFDRMEVRTLRYFLTLFHSGALQCLCLS